MVKSAFEEEIIDFVHSVVTCSSLLEQFPVFRKIEFLSLEEIQRN